MLITSVTKAQTFDFSCDNSYLFSEEYEGSWGRTERRYFDPAIGEWEEWTDYNEDNFDNLLYSFNLEDIYFAYGSATNVNTCRSKNRQIRGNELWVVEEHSDTLKLKSYYNDDPEQGIQMSCKWWGVNDTVYRRWTFEDGFILERKHLRYTENFNECTENEDEIITVRSEALRIINTLICEDKDMHNIEYNRILGAGIYALTDGGYNMLIADLNNLIASATADQSNNTLDTLSFELSQTNTTTVHITATFTVDDCNYIYNDVEIYIDNVLWTGSVWNRQEARSGDNIMIYNFDLIDLPDFNQMTIMLEDNVGNMSSFTVNN